MAGIPATQEWVSSLISKSIRASSGGSGEKPPRELKELTDVVITSPESGQVPTYNADTQMWENKPQQGGGSSDYSKLTNKPSINGVELDGNKTSSDLHIEFERKINQPGNITELVYKEKIGDTMYGYQPTYAYPNESVKKIKYLRFTLWGDRGLEVGDIQFSKYEDTNEFFSYSGASVSCNVDCFGDAPASQIIYHNQSGRLGTHSGTKPPVVIVTLSDSNLLDANIYKYAKIYRGRDSVTGGRRLMAYAIDYSIDGVNYKTMVPKTDCSTANLYSWGLASVNKVECGEYEYKDELDAVLVNFKSENLEATNVDEAINEVNDKIVNIEANPEETATEDLKKIKIGESVFKIPEGGGGSGSNIHKYSTDEQVVGEWIDGKPIYEKTIYLEFTQNTRQVNAQYVIDENPIYERIISTQNFDYLNTINKPRFDNIDIVRLYSSIVDNKLYVNVETGYDRSQMATNIAIQYTKTTD